MCNVAHWVSGRFSALHFVLPGPISNGGDHGMHGVLAGFSSNGNSIHNIYTHAHIYTLIHMFALSAGVVEYSDCFSAEG